MKNLNTLKKLLLGMTFLSLASGLSACQKDKSEPSTPPSSQKEVEPGFVPQDWLLPTAGSTALTAKTAVQSNENSQAMDQAVDAILDSHLSALEQVKDVDSAQAQLMNDKRKPKDWVPWRMVTFTAELGVGVSGLIGTLTGAGTPSVQVFYERKPQKPAAVEETKLVTNDNQEPGFVLSSESGESDMNAQMEPVVKSLMASGRVKDESKLRASLKEYLRQFQSAMSSVTDTTQTEWYVGRMRFDLAVAASGFVTVTWGTVAADAKIRLEWLPIPKKTKPMNVLAKNSFEENLARNLGSFVSAVAEELIVMSGEVAPGCAYKLDEVQVGIGGSVKGDVGFAKGKVAPMAYVSFYRRAKPTGIAIASLSTEDLESSNDLLIITDEAQLGLYPMVTNNVVSVDSVTKEAIVKLPRKALRTGLMKASKMGSYFAARAEKKTAAKWGISKIKTQVALSLTGTTGVVTVSGDVFAQLVYKNMKF